MNNEANTVGTDVETLVIEGTEWLRKDVADKRIEELEFIVGALYGYYQLIQEVIAKPNIIENNEIIKQFKKSLGTKEKQF